MKEVDESKWEMQLYNGDDATMIRILITEDRSWKSSWSDWKTQQTTMGEVTWVGLGSSD